MPLIFFGLFNNNIYLINDYKGIYVLDILKNYTNIINFW